MRGRTRVRTLRAPHRSGRAGAATRRADKGGRAMCRSRPLPSASIPEPFTLAGRSVLAERFHRSRQAPGPKQECRRGRATHSQLRSLESRRPSRDAPASASVTGIFAPAPTVSECAELGAPICSVEMRLQSGSTAVRPVLGGSSARAEVRRIGGSCRFDCPVGRTRMCSEHRGLSDQVARPPVLAGFGWVRGVCAARRRGACSWVRGRRFLPVRARRSPRRRSLG